jgi:hypothetical protein
VAALTAVGALSIAAVVGIGVWQLYVAGLLQSCYLRAIAMLRER